MSDRIKGFIVTLKADLREEDAERLADAMRMLQGIASVTPSVSTPDDWMNREQVNFEWRQKLIALVNETRKS